MLKGLIKIYSFTIKTDMSSDEAKDKLDKLYYQKLSPIELFHVEQKESKLVISFIQEKSNFKFTTTSKWYCYHNKHIGKKFRTI